MFEFVSRVTKRICDIIGALIALILFSPIILVMGISIKLKMGSPLLFTQNRPGLNGKPFKMLKFRTMTDARDSNGKMLSDEERLTAMGRFMRSSSLDELPEFINVLKGDMSLVGPRPLLMQYLGLYSSEQARRHEVRPGITGWAQVNGRNALSWEDKFKLDVWYIDNWSLLLDLKIIGLTLIALLKHEGISAEGHATMPIFTGGKEMRNEAATTNDDY